MSSSDSEGLGLLFYIEPRLEVVDHVFAGVRFGFALNANQFEHVDIFEHAFDTRFDNAVFAVVPAVYYYFDALNWNDRTIVPYLGAGLGYYLLSGVEVLETNSIGRIAVDVPNRVGLHLRGGVEFRKLRLGVEYNLMKKADAEILDAQKVGTVDNRYWAFSVGYLIGV